MPSQIKLKTAQTRSLDQLLIIVAQASTIVYNEFI